MRRLIRTDAPADVTLALNLRTVKVEKGANATDEWGRYRKSKSYDVLRVCLSGLAGPTERCCFCSDSLGVDVEHYRPKSNYPACAFDWSNLLLACAGCNRLKGDRFELLDDGTPALIDPTLDDPWDSLFFDDLTGNIAPRLLKLSDGNPVYSERGLYTVSLLENVLNRTSVQKLRVSAWTALLDRLEHLCATGEIRGSKTPRSLLSDFDRFGLVSWAIDREGAESAVVRGLKQNYGMDWRWLRDNAMVEI